MRVINVTMAVLSQVALVFGQSNVVSYECNSLPTQEGWTLVQAICDPAEWVEDGWLIHDVDFCSAWDPPPGQFLDYTRSIQEFNDEEAFFLEYRMHTDGPASEFISVAPAVVAMGCSCTPLYHFMMAIDRVRYRFYGGAWWEIAIEPDVPHTYRLELFGDAMYVWMIDGQLIAEGVPAGDFPNLNSAINLGAKSANSENEVYWDYIRYGRIPEDGSFDYDSSESVDLADYYFVEECVESSGPNVDAGPGCHFADSDRDQDIDLRDIAAFQNAFSGESE